MQIDQLFQLMKDGTLETLYMVIVSTIIAYVIGIPTGVILFITDKNGISENSIVNKIVGVIVNLLRSVPFIILLL